MEMIKIELFLKPFTEYFKLINFRICKYPKQAYFVVNENRLTSGSHWK